MNLLGIDVGTTGCKAALFSLQGKMLASAYREYDPKSPQPSWAELDSAAIWEDVKAVIREIQALVVADKLDIDTFGAQGLKQQPVVFLPPFRHRYQMPGMSKGCEPFAASGSHVQQMHIRGQDTTNQVFIAPWGRFLLVFAIKIGKVPADK